MAIIRKDLITVLSDTHLGTGGRLDDFRQDELFIRLLDKLEQQFSVIWGKKVLILNGDIFDLIQSLHLFKVSPEPLSVFKKIKNAHPGFFQRLNSFSKKYRVIFQPGNHDFQLSLGTWGSALRQLLPHVNVAKQDQVTTYQRDGKAFRIISCHGHQYDPINRIKDGQSWGNSILELIINVLEDFFPELDNVSVFALCQFLEKRLSQTFEKMTGVLPQTALNPISLVCSLLKGGPESQIGIILQLLHLFMESTAKSGEKFSKAAQRLAHGSRREKGETAIAVFGHTHHACLQAFNETTLYVNSGCWIDEVTFDEETRRFTAHPRADYLLFGSDQDPLNLVQTVYSMV